MRSSPEERLSLVEKRLRARYGQPDHHNPSDPALDIVFLVLSRMTQETKYLRSYRALVERYADLEGLRAAPIRELAGVLRDLGLADTKARQIKELLTLIEKHEGSISLDRLHGLDDESRIHIGLAFMDAIAKRWPDLPQGKEANQIFDHYKARPTRPWEEEAKRERLEQTQFLAELYDREASGIGLSKLQRAVLAQGAIDNWRIILSDSDDETLLAKARTRIEPLEKLVANMPGKGKSRFDDRTRQRKDREQGVAPTLIPNANPS